ncbi:hypothetical protein NLJ89_g3654 [Agrocybe chaxingu]|uniref:Uncharacterized protein n=1 Tax=Agrocybe chaxingu TaxID=84603 RepID=A0A9W8MVA4_9AGAR|nr:hypothetical protein NLJ89_g3654 [Agrocybe chaxingu]
MPKGDAFATAVFPPSALTGRKTRKTLDSQKKELVWPDDLEEALLEVIAPASPAITDGTVNEYDDTPNLAIPDATNSRAFDQIQLNVALSTTGISAHLGLDAEIMSHGARTLPDLPFASLAGRVPNVTLFSSLLDPTVACYCAFTVYYNNSILIHAEKTSLTSFILPSGSVKYTTPLLPDFWGKLISKSDLDHYTIVQDIVQEGTVIHHHLIH